MSRINALAAVQPRPQISMQFDARARQVQMHVWDERLAALFVVAAGVTVGLALAAAVRR